jgi:hypothetical protein
MAINKVGSKGIADGSVATADFAPGTVINAKLENSSITFSGTSIALGASNTVNIGADWQSVQTSSFTAVAGKGYFIDTTSGAITVTLPASASIGDFIAIKDYAGTFATNNLTVARNGHNIQGVANDSLITTNRASLVLVYVDSTKGWLYLEEHNVNFLGPLYVTATGGTVTESGDYKIHSFTGDGCFVVSCAGNPTGSNSVDYLVVAGGGSGGAMPGSAGGGGGGAGGARVSSGSASGCYTAGPLGSGVSALSVTATTYPVTVGGGGSNGNGSNSVFSTITSTGGGRGGSSSNGNNGGSGGGAGSPGNSGGSGNTPPTSPSQGNNGGAGGTSAPNYAGGGGGGATSVGAAGTLPCAPSRGAGGSGITSCITASPVGYAGGGGNGIAGGNLGDATDGGGVGGYPGGFSGNADANKGGGGGGSGRPDDSGGNGGKGIVIIRYKYQ